MLLEVKYFEIVICLSVNSVLFIFYQVTVKKTRGAFDMKATYRNGQINHFFQFESHKFSSLLSFTKLSFQQIQCNLGRLYSKAPKLQE